MHKIERLVLQHTSSDRIVELHKLTSTAFALVHSQRTTRAEEPEGSTCTVIHCEFRPTEPTYAHVPMFLAIAA